MGYAPSFTPRYIARYRAGGREHDILIRGALGENQSATVTRGQTVCHALMLALVGKLPDDFLWISAKYIPEDSEVSQPAGPPEDVTGALALNTFSKKDRIAAVHFAGRSQNSPAGLFVYSLQFSEDVVPDGTASDFVITADEDADILSAIAALRAQTMHAIDGTPITWYNRVTYKTNDFYVKKVRKGQ